MQIVVQYARQVLGDTAARNMCQTFDFDGLHERKDRLYVNARRNKQPFGSRRAVNFGVVTGALKDLANQRVAVRVRSARGYADQYIVRSNPTAIDHLRAFYGADAKASQVVVAVGIHVRHFRRLATDQGGTGQFTAGSNTIDDAGCNLDIEMPTRKVIKKEQRFGSLYQHIVNAHGDQVDTDRAVLVQLLRQHQLGAYAVGSRYEHGFLVAPGWQRKQAAKAAEPGHHFGTACAGDRGLDAVNERIAGLDIDAGVFIGQWFLGHPEIANRWEKNGRTLRGRYNSRWASQGKPPYMKFIRLALIGVLAFSSATAVEVTSLYTAQVPLDQEQSDPRAEAYEIALAQVLLRVSGPVLVNDQELFEALFPRPSAYVVQYRPGPDDTLFVSFDGDAVEEVLRSAGQTVWGSERPLTMVWLAVDWGQGQREIIGATDAERSVNQARSINRQRLLRERILNFAESRGLPVAFPLLDSEDMAGVSFSDVWGGFDERLIEASRRYDVNSVLIGRVRADSAQRNRWSYHFGGEQHAWTGEPELAIMQISDLLAAEFAIGADAPVRSVNLHISGVNSVSAFGEVQNILGRANVVEDFSITAVAGDRVSFRVAAHGGGARLARALRFAGLIEQDRIDMDDFGIEVPAEELEFFYGP